MKYTGMPLGMWVLFSNSFRKQLTTVALVMYLPLVDCSPHYLMKRRSKASDMNSSLQITKSIRSIFMKKTVLTFIVCSLLTYVLSFACAFFGFIGPVFWVGIGVPAALLCAFPMVYLLGKNRIPGQMILTSIVFILISFAIGEIWKPLNAAVMLAAGVLGEGIIAVW